MSSPTKSPWVYRSFFHPGTQAIGYGLLVLAFLIFADYLSMHYGLSEVQRIVDDVCGAAIAGLLIYRNERSRSKYLTEKLKTIELMNHHVRNALQVISDSAYLHGHTQQIDQVQAAVKRVDWALREILPGRVLDEYQDPASQNPGSSGGRSVA
jgi:hypothetical protein